MFSEVFADFLRMKPRPHPARIVSALAVSFSVCGMALSAPVGGRWLSSASKIPPPARPRAAFLSKMLKYFPVSRAPQMTDAAFQRASDGGRQGSPQTIGEGVTESVEDIQKRGGRKRGKPKKRREAGRRAPYPDRRSLPQNPQSPPTSQFPPPETEL
jgi:hypothetical protein